MERRAAILTRGGELEAKLARIVGTLEGPAARAGPVTGGDLAQAGTAASAYDPPASPSYDPVREPVGDSPADLAALAALAQAPNPPDDEPTEEASPAVIQGNC